MSHWSLDSSKARTTHEKKKKYQYQSISRNYLGDKTQCHERGEMLSVVLPHSSMFLSFLYIYIHTLLRPHKLTHQWKPNRDPEEMRTYLIVIFSSGFVIMKMSNKKRIPGKNAAVNKSITENHSQICPDFNLGRTQTSKQSRHSLEERKTKSQTKRLLDP